MLVSEIRQKLIESGKYTQEEVNNIKGKATLMEHYTATFGESLLDKLVVEDTDVHTDVEETQEDGPPSYLDAGWSDYVMSLFKESELSDKLPTVHGLRRVAELLLGPILKSSPINYEIRGESPGHATCFYEVVFKWKRNEEGQEDLGDWGERRFGALAGSYEGNTDPEYAVYSEAIAETRAEVRALRKALRINVVAAEEVSKKAIQTAIEKTRQIEWDSDAICDTIQIKSIHNMCMKHKVSMDKLLLTRGIDNVNKMTKAQAVEILLWLNKVQTNNESVPEELKG